ncbi:hypothetical protein HanIR_Chr12g0608161 [Helianthus annuus]|nr:hypothetical protein HanIR_Chr12g0608161 [Helianthus annuus]
MVGLELGHELTHGVRAPPPPPSVSDVSGGYSGAWVGAWLGSLLKKLQKIKKIHTTLKKA